MIMELNKIQDMMLAFLNNEYPKVDFIWDFPDSLINCIRNDVKWRVTEI